MSREKGRWKIEQRFVVGWLVVIHLCSAEFLKQSSQKLTVLVEGSSYFSPMKHLPMKKLSANETLTANERFS